VADGVNLALLRDETLVIQIDFAAGPSPRSETDTWAEGAAVLTAAQRVAIGESPILSPPDSFSGNTPRSLPDPVSN
jgi:hypothetical protein